MSVEVRHKFFIDILDHIFYEATQLDGEFLIRCL